MRRVAAAAALLIACACGATSTASQTAVAGSMQVLSAGAVPGLAYTTTPLTPADLAKDAAIPGLASMVTSWGYEQGAQRTFQGQSRHLTYVVSRALVFRDSAGAASYVSFVHSNATSFFGVAGVQALSAQGRPGWQFIPSACACHMANPVVVGLVSDGPAVSWLEINGPDAGPNLLVSLLDPAKSAPVSS